MCRAPRANNWCLALPRIRETRDDEREEAIKGKSWEDLTPKERPACQAERGAFMAPFEVLRYHDHPYAKSSKAHRHFDTTPQKTPARSAACIPFGWMLKEGAEKHTARLNLGFRQELEDKAHELMDFETNWVQVKENQLALLDTFFGALREHESLCFLYAKDTPVAEDPRRVIIGVGRVTHVAEFTEYRYKGPGWLKAVLWDRPVKHSIRGPDFADGFLFPYHELLERAAVEPDLDLARYVAFAPDEARLQFSYAAEHVTHDVAVASLLVCAETLRRLGEKLPGPWERLLGWVDAELNRLWKLRGPYPGLGSALTAFGIDGGTLVAYDLALAQEGASQEWAEDPWDLVDAAMKDPSVLGEGVRKHLDETKRRAYLKLTAERKSLLTLLSRFTLTSEQATRFYQESERAKAGLAVADAQLIANPYLLYELDRSQPDPIPVGVIDRGVFPDAVVADRFPLAAPSTMEGDADARRSRALVVHVLEEAAAAGHTLQPQLHTIQAVRDLEVQPKCSLSLDLLAVVGETLPPAVRTVEMADGATAYQLERLSDVGEVVRNTVEKRLKGKRFEGAHHWRAIVDNILPRPEAGVSDAEARLEEKARTEKALALEEMFRSRLSVLTGSAGTGKTTLLKALCNLPEVARGGVLLLAPTGKARVRMETQIGRTGAQTIAQFLLPLGRYVPATGQYRLAPDRDKVQGHGTVIIDEASMLTEEQLGAVLDALRPPDRLILVGDPKQLPPIGSGRPFVDIVRRLSGETPGGAGQARRNMAELTVQRRHRGEQRLDLLLAEWFTGRDPGPGADEVWDRLARAESQHVKLVRWDREEQLQELLLEELRIALNLKSLDDEDGFERSLGGSPFGNAVYFFEAKEPGRGEPDSERRPGAAQDAENWQILSPIRGGQAGVEALNRRIQAQFRKRALAWAEPEVFYDRRTPKPSGRHGILYGDKVINVTNGRRKDVWPLVFGGRDALAYVANGEIGMVVGDYQGVSAKQRRRENGKKVTLPWKLQVEFSSQVGFKYTFKPWEFKEEGDQPLELAYALTVHKTQGSEFGSTFLVLPSPCRLLSPELLYTALTRQKQRIVVFHQGDLADLKKYSRTYFSETARRMTNLLAPPAPVSLDDRFLEEGLIHRTRRGEAVRSKSEVVIADLLFSLKIDYEYEKELVGFDGSRRWPDFTIDDPESGTRVYWEHLGMLDDPRYRDRWERKLAWYRSSGIAPEEEDGGPAGTLVCSRDDERGGIDSAEIERIAKRVLRPEP